MGGELGKINSTYVFSLVFLVFFYTISSILDLIVPTFIITSLYYEITLCDISLRTLLFFVWYIYKSC
jgi:hypothetical protein